MGTLQLGFAWENDQVRKTLTGRGSAARHLPSLRPLLPAGLPPGPPTSSRPPASTRLGFGRKNDYLRKALAAAACPALAAETVTPAAAGHPPARVCVGKRLSPQNPNRPRQCRETSPFSAASPTCGPSSWPADVFAASCLPAARVSAKKRLSPKSPSRGRLPRETSLFSAAPPPGGPSSWPADVFAASCLPAVRVSSQNRLSPQSPSRGGQPCSRDLLPPRCWGKLAK